MEVGRVIRSYTNYFQIHDPSSMNLCFLIKNILCIHCPTTHTAAASLVMCRAINTEFTHPDYQGDSVLLTKKHTNGTIENESSVHSCVITSLLLPWYLFTVNTLVSIILFPCSLLCGVTPWQRFAWGEFHSSCQSLCPHVETFVDEHTHKQVPVRFHKQNHKQFSFVPLPPSPQGKSPIF